MKSSAPLYSCLFIFMLICISCGSVKPFYEKGTSPPPSISSNHESIVNSCFLTGGVRLDQPSPVLEGILKQADQKNALILLGDVLSLDDVASSLQNETSSELAVMTRLKSLDQAFNECYLIPGEKEWISEKKTSVENLHALDKLLKDVKSKGRLMIPAKDCGMPEVVRIADHTIVVLMDSQWAIETESHPEENFPSCELSNVLELRNAIKDIIQSHPADYIVFASHHPLFANGPTAGNYPLSSHLLPLPIIGSLITGIKSLVSSDQHFGHPAYEAYRSAMLTAMEGCKNCVVVSGHEKSLQYYHRGGVQFLVAGSGEQYSHARKGEKSGFSYMSEGFVRIDELKNSDLRMSFFALHKGAPAELVWQKDIKPFRSENKSLSATASDLMLQDSILLPASTRYAKKDFLRGEFYRKAWSLPVKMQVLHLESVHGGLEPKQLGGGNQTRSLRLENKSGEQYVLRSIDKKVSAVLPPALRGSFAENIVQDGIAASHPYGALVIPQLAKAVGVYYTNPSIVYVPHQAALGIYDKEIGDGVYLFEERPGGNTASFSNFGNAQKTFSTSDVIELIADSPLHKIDQAAVARARLFDIWLGDWDRHDDQWRWTAKEENGMMIYQPIPRDRDQVFFKNDGVLDYIASRPYFNPPLRMFTPEIDHLDGVIWAGKYFDRSFLHQLSEQDFVAVATSMQQQLSDEVIENAFNDWPAAIDNLDGKRIRDGLKARRDDLATYAAEFYRLINGVVFIPATSDKDVITLDATGSGKLDVTIVRKEKDHLYPHFHQVYDDDITKEIRLFGLNKSDSLILKGDGTFSGRIRFIGGPGEDYMANGSSHLRIHAYDATEGMLTSGGSIQSHFNDKPINNSFDRMDWNLDRSIHFIAPTYYTDEGLGLHYTFWWTRFGFRADPFKSKHAVGLSYFFGTSGLIGTYKGDWRHVLGDIDLGLDLLGSSPTFTQYWYGYGNSYIDYGEKKKYHIVEGGRWQITPSLIRRFGFGSLISLTPEYQYINIENDADEPRFINTPESGLTADDFGSHHYVGIQAAYRFTRLDNPGYPTRGIDLNVYAGGRSSLGDQNIQHAVYGLEGGFYLPFNVTGTVVLATHVRADRIAGDYEFFHALPLSGDGLMRGYFSNRFTGDSRFLQSTDLRLKLFSKQGVVPFQLGVFGAFDYGRVWYDGDGADADTWHTAIGGGLYIVPLGITAFRLGYMKGDDDVQITLGGALRF